MIYFFYNLLTTVVVVLGLPFFLIKLITTPKYRPGAAQRLGFYPKEAAEKLRGREVLWIHAVSVGEVIAALPLMRELRRRYPERKIALTTVTATGNRIARAQAKEADVILFFPFDLKPIVGKAIRLTHPALFILIETEIWPNCIHALFKKKIPSLVVNGRISRNSFSGYRRIRFLMSRVLPEITAFSMQTKEDARRIIALGAPPERVRNTGNIKFDITANPLTGEEARQIRNDYLLPPEGPIFIAGSTHPGEEEIIIKIYRQRRKVHPDLTLILAPRHPERCSEVEEHLRTAGLSYQKRSHPETGKEVLLLDTVGELSRLYGIATVAFVGGSLIPHGGHNILEPAVYGVPALFGPHMENFPEISKIMKERRGGIECDGAEQLGKTLEELLNDPGKRKIIGRAGRTIIEENQGALEQTLTLIDQQLTAV
ncbi:MAG: 3-deoxy-D-manno-octulosonic acid transferase [Deltaproteobacteria bacterium]|nr:3-deoxy-D-manno-octulosonic acid transferase [Deltaproteobacteria bacterium]